MGFTPRIYTFKFKFRLNRGKCSRLKWEQCMLCNACACYTLAFSLKLRKYANIPQAE